ncbi:MAG TPA: DUF84 family protein [Candidatus Nanoarchaeia archaeon]|nr:DUF84 family protein [Candidatus Nanoarchaeia archaeon]
MLIRIGTQNPVKIAAVTEVLGMCKPFFEGAQIETEAVSSGVAEQPRDLQEIVRGAINRGRNARRNADFGIGIEGGFGYLGYGPRWANFNVCALVRHEERIWTGISAGFEVDPRAVRLILDQDIDLDEAYRRLGLVTSARAGYEEQGITGYVTNGMRTRKDDIKEATLRAISSYLRERK